MATRNANGGWDITDEEAAEVTAASFPDDEPDDDYDETEVRIRFHLSTNKIRSAVDTVIDTGYEQGEWDEMDDFQKDRAMLEVFLERAMPSLGGWDWEEVGDG